jgi:hypothetical protein
MCRVSARRLLKFIMRLVDGSKGLNLIKRICCIEYPSSFDDNNMINICQKDTKAIRAMLLENITKPNGKRF